MRAWITFTVADGAPHWAVLPPSYAFWTPTIPILVPDVITTVVRWALLPGSQTTRLPVRPAAAGTLYPYGFCRTLLPLPPARAPYPTVALPCPALFLVPERYRWLPMPSPPSRCRLACPALAAFLPCALLLTVDCWRRSALLDTGGPVAVTPLCPTFPLLPLIAFATRRTCRRAPAAHSAPYWCVTLRSLFPALPPHLPCVQPAVPPHTCLHYLCYYYLFVLYCVPAWQWQPLLTCHPTTLPAGILPTCLPADPLHTLTFYLLTLPVFGGFRFLPPGVVICTLQYYLACLPDTCPPLA